MSTKLTHGHLLPEESKQAQFRKVRFLKWFYQESNPSYRGRKTWTMIKRN